MALHEEALSFSSLYLLLAAALTFLPPNPPGIPPKINGNFPKVVFKLLYEWQCVSKKEKIKATH